MINLTREEAMALLTLCNVSLEDVLSAYEKLRDFVGAEPAEEPAEPVPDPEEQQLDPEPKKRKRNPGGKMGAPKQIDRGKVFALRKAGWTAAKIADEMKCSLGTVKRILQEEAPYEQDERVFID